MIKDRNEQFWGDHAAVYDTEIDKVIGRDSREAIYDFLLGFRDLGNVVEFGCGPGFFTRAVALNATHVLATDIADQMLDRAKANLKDVKNISFQKVNGERMPFPDNLFDTVFTANVVQILEHPEQALKEAHRVLKPGGRLILLYYNFDDLGTFDKFMIYVRFLSRFHGVPYRHMMSPDEIRAMAEDAGFKVEDLKKVGGRVKAIYLLGRKPL
jgi:ubiquinone/menaquinone biosynthesis C-methylase UbiE